MIDAPSGGAPEKAPRWDLMGTEGCGGGIRFLAPVLIVRGYVGIHRRKGTSVELRGAHEVGGAPSTLVTSSEASWSRVQVSWIMFGEKIRFSKVSFRLDSV